MDLRRMQNLIQRHLKVPGEVDHSVANIFIVSRASAASSKITRRCVLPMLHGVVGAGLEPQKTLL